MRAEALFVIDMQRYLYRGKARPHMDRASAAIEGAIADFRAAGKPIVWIHHRDARSKIDEGHPDFAFIPSLVPMDGEGRVTKGFSDGFRETELGPILKGLGVDSLLLCGFRAEGCVLFTFLGARRGGYSARLLEGGVASSSAFRIKAVEALLSRRR